MNVLIVGNGIMALSTAFQLLKSDNLKITIVGPSSRTGAATPAAAAMLNSFAEVESSTLKNEYGRLYFRISRDAARKWPSFEREVVEKVGQQISSLCKGCDVDKGGCFSKGTYIYHNAVSDSLEDKNYAAIKSALIGEGEDFCEVLPSEIPGYSPAASSRALEALYIPDEGWVNPNMILDNLERAVYLDERCEYVDDSVVNFTWSDQQVVGASLHSGSELSGFDKVLLANGSMLSGLLKSSPFEAIVQPVLSSFGTSIEMSCSAENLPSNCIRSPNRGGGCGTYVASYYKGHGIKNNYFVGASAIIRERPSFYGRAISIAHLLHGAINEVNTGFYGAEVIKINAGNRPVSFDQFPLLGSLGTSNVVIATGTKRDGLHCAPSISEYLSEEITSGVDENHPYKAFKPDRNLIQLYERIESIGAIVEMKVNEAYQHQYNPSSPYQLELFKTSLADEAQRVHDFFEMDTKGIHPSMYPLYREIAEGRMNTDYMNWYRN